MDFPQPLVRGTLVQRYKRFFADCVLDDGREVTAHCPNPGAMLGLNMPGLPVWLSKSDDPKRKLAHTLELVEVDGAPVGINTMHPNRLVAEALAAGAIPELAGYDSVRREVKYSHNSRVDFLLQSEGRPNCWLEVKPLWSERQQASSGRCWVEVKNCHYMPTPGLAEFPDCVAARSLKHLNDLEEMVKQGDRAVVLFVIQRTDCDAFAASHDRDPAFAAGLERVANSGVEVLAYRCDLSPHGITLKRPIPWQR